MSTDVFAVVLIRCIWPIRVLGAVCPVNRHRRSVPSIRHLRRHAHAAFVSLIVFRKSAPANILIRTECALATLGRCI